jgi:hypothetical protein
MSNEVLDELDQKISFVGEEVRQKGRPDAAKDLQELFRLREEFIRTLANAAGNFRNTEATV